MSRPRLRDQYRATVHPRGFVHADWDLHALRKAKFLRDVIGFERVDDEAAEFIAGLCAHGEDMLTGVARLIELGQEATECRVRRETLKRGAA